MSISLIDISGQASFISMFSAACAAAIAHRNNFFCLYQREKFSDSKVKFKQKSPLLPRNLALVTFGVLLIVFSTNVNLL